MIVSKLQPGDTFKDSHGNQVSVMSVEAKGEWVNCDLKVLTGHAKGRQHGASFLVTAKGIDLGEKAGDFVPANRRSLS
ncbi:MAG: hypothetical protein AAB358_01240 [Patescibacteria group bacterium]